MLNAEQKSIIDSTLPAVKERGEEITKAFYRHLFTRYPEVKGMFDMEKQENGKQPKALAMAILNGAKNLANLEKIRPSVESIGKVHTKLNVKPEHYPLVGECLLIAIKEVLEDAATDDVIEAWGAAYGVLADFYIAIEKEIYAKAQ